VKTGMKGFLFFAGLCAVVVCAQAHVNYTGAGYHLSVYSCEGCSGSVLAEVFGDTEKCVNLNIPGYEYVRVTCSNDGYYYGVTVFTNDKCTMQNTNVEQPQVFYVAQCVDVPTAQTNGDYHVPPNFAVSCNLNQTQKDAVDAEKLLDANTFIAVRAQADNIALMYEREAAEALAITAAQDYALALEVVEDETEKVVNLTAAQLALLAAESSTMTQENAQTAMLAASQVLEAKTAVLQRRAVQKVAADVANQTAYAAFAAQSLVRDQAEAAWVTAQTAATSTHAAAATATPVSSTCNNSPCLNGGTHPAPVFANCTCPGAWLGPICSLPSPP
jgi:hypothetical protein